MSVNILNVPASVHQRLINESRARSVDFNLLLARFANERFLYRLAQSPYVERFVLSGRHSLTGARCVMSHRIWPQWLRKSRAFSSLCSMQLQVGEHFP